MRGGILEMDEPEHSTYRGALNPYLSPAAIKRWQPFVDEIVRAALDEKIESGRIDFVDDLANIVPAVLTLAMMGIELNKWPVYSEPAHLSVSTPEHSPDAPRVAEMNRQMGIDMITTMMELRENPRPGMINALLQLRIDGEPAPDLEILGNLGLIIGGGFDTTTALTAHSLEWLSEHPDQRELLSRERDTLLNPATEEFLRFYTPAPGDGRTVLRRTSRSRATGSRRASGCGSPGPWPIAIRRCSRTRTSSSWTGRATGTSASASACTAASAPTWRAPCSSRC